MKEGWYKAEFLISNLFYLGQVNLVVFFRACWGFSVLSVGDGDVWETGLSSHIFAFIYCFDEQMK